MPTSAKNRQGVLFVLRKRGTECWGDEPYGNRTSGLRNSAVYMNQMLQQLGIKSRLVDVVDANGIDREVFQFNPEVVILEAVWCPPAKLTELT